MRRLLLERFERELLLSSRVSHPHVLQVHDCGELRDGRPYVLLEWMDRGDLVELLDTAWAVKSNLPLRHIHYYATSIASAMRAVHAAQVVHRDIKPDNVLLRKDGVAKITDFGVAKDISGESSDLTEVGQTMGTLGFMAPEQLLGLPGPQSDIFSFGITLYRLICAKVPPQVTVNAIPVGRILEEAWEDVPESWTPFLKKLTAPQLEDRAASFDAVLELLRDIDPSEIDDRPLLNPEHLPPLPSAEFGAVGGVTMGNLPPIPERATKIPKVRSHANPNRDTSGV
jgi:serine/threonine protein kinase